MKTKINLLTGIAAVALFPSCQGFLSGNQGKIIISINQSQIPATRSIATDVESFMLTVTDSNGKTVWSGRYGDSPDEIVTSAGTYTVTALSGSFDEASYEAPQYGDSQVATVPAGGSVSVKLLCSQMNSGVRLAVEDSFERTFPEGVLYLSGAGGKLMFDYDENRTAYFKPGTLTVSLHDDGKENTLFTRNLSAREMLVIKMSSESGSTSGGVSVQVDTSRSWIKDEYAYGGTQGGGDISDACSVEEARSILEKKNTWVYGYVVGVATGTSKFSFQAPFTKNTNLVLGSRSNTTDGEHCLAVELKSGTVRDALNLMDNQKNLGRKLYLRGDIVPSYYGIPGIKNVTEFEFR